ncbi:sn-1-specific diacylglycerol lipase ABHD11-like [Amphiura filiformis]|uniref:sn-1-specific diacylglycerol lipase ABHD11-like n=1 Tax=Amphiura filiformis TaxID=82378 RepID=UPI003B226153
MALRYFSKLHKHQASVCNLLTPPGGVVCNANFAALALQKCNPSPSPRVSSLSSGCGCGSSAYFVRAFSSRPVKLAYDVLEGDPGHDSSPIVILHGLFGSKNNWSSLAKKMNLELGRTVVAVDARNHGESEHNDEMSYEAMSQDIVNLIKNELKVEKCTLIGHSMGGKTAMYTAITQPSVVDSLLVVDIAPCPSPSSAMNIEAYMTTLMKIKFDNSLTLSQVRRNVATQIVEHLPDMDASLRYFMSTNVVQRGDEFAWRINLKAILDHREDIGGFPEVNKTYNGITEFVGGSKSEYIGPKTLPDIKRLFPEAIIRSISGAGHWVHSDNPQEFLEVVRPFLHE